jgi:hypothetical protein
MHIYGKVVIENLLNILIFGVFIFAIITLAKISDFTVYSSRPL